jgi:hypothetical protein
MARAKRPVEPGDQLVMDGNRARAPASKFKGVARVGEDIACEARAHVHEMPLPDPQDSAMTQIHPTALVDKAHDESVSIGPHRRPARDDRRARPWGPIA